MTACAGLFVMALNAPIPATGNEPMQRVLAEVSERLPGWEIVHATEAWEGGYTIVTRCAGRELAFQLFPGGLPVGDHLVQVHDDFARSRLVGLSDNVAFSDRAYIIWRAHPIRDRSFSCGRQLADDAPGVARRAQFLREREAW
jgi:hypothetical protein